LALWKRKRLSVRVNIKGISDPLMLRRSFAACYFGIRRLVILRAPRTTPEGLSRVPHVIVVRVWQILRAIRSFECDRYQGIYDSRDVSRLSITESQAGYIMLR
jgi:hypothetical protein